MERFEPKKFMQMLQYCRMSNEQSLNYWTRWFKRIFVQYSQNFAIRCIQRRSSSANFVMEVLTTEIYLSNPESNCSKFVGIFTRPCLKYGWYLVGFDLFVPEKSHDHSLIIFHHKRTLNGFWHPGWKDHFLESDTVKSNLICLAFRKLHTVVIYCYEGQALHLSAWGWGTYLLTRW
jgi:hypothetical protein